MKLITNQIDKWIFKLICAFFINLFLIWLIVNFIKTNNNLLLFITIPVSLAIAYLSVQEYRFKLNKINNKEIKALIILFFLLLFVALYFLEPLIRYPFSTTGVPNKDLHDSISYFISQNGRSPRDFIYKASDTFIFNSYGYDALGYPNLLHSLSALFIKLGISELHVTYFSVLFALIMSSLSIYLFLKYLYKDEILSSIIAGLFGMTSLRIIFATVVSIPMAFAYNLIFPAFLIFVVSLHYSDKKTHYLLPMIVLSTIGVSYLSIVIIFLALIFVYLLLLIFNKDYLRMFKAMKIVIFSLPLLVFVLAEQHEIFWTHLFFGRRSFDYDPNDLSHQFFNFENPLYMFIYLLSFAIIFHKIIKSKKWPVNEDLLKIFLLIINLFLIILIPYDLLFRKLHNIQLNRDILSITPKGIFGGINHQIVARLSFLQPYFFIFIIAETIYFFKKKIIGIVLFILIVLTTTVIRMEKIYPLSVMKEMKSYFYNQPDKNKLYNLPSHFYLLFNKEMWTKDYENALIYLKKNAKPEDLIFLKDEYFWLDEAAARWGTLYLKQRIFNTNQIKSNFYLDNQKALKKVNDDFNFILIAHYSFVNNPTITVSGNWRQVYKNPNMKIFGKIKP